MAFAKNPFSPRLSTSHFWQVSEVWAGSIPLGNKVTYLDEHQLLVYFAVHGTDGGRDGTIGDSSEKTMTLEEFLAQ